MPCGSHLGRTELQHARNPPKEMQFLLQKDIDTEISKNQVK
jgi:hypothetical protein